MKLTIITINYNSSESTIKLLKSLENQSDQDFKIIVIDNASEEADFKNLKVATMGIFVATKMPIVIKNIENLGFSGGNNVGIRQALDPSTRLRQEIGADWVLLLNNDTWLKNDFISHIKAVLGHCKGLVGLPLVESDKVTHCGQIQWLKPTLRHVYDMCKTELYTYVIGGAMLIHRSVFDKIGLLDEKYFLYFEDADFSIRARKAGIPITILENPKVHHSVQESTKKLGSSTLLYYHYRNALYFNSKNGPWYIKILNWFWRQWIVKKQLFKIIFNINRKQSKAILEGAYDYYTKKFGKR